MNLFIGVVLLSVVTTLFLCIVVTEAHNWCLHHASDLDHIKASVNRFHAFCSSHMFKYSLALDSLSEFCSTGSYNFTGIPLSVCMVTRDCVRLKQKQSHLLSIGMEIKGVYKGNVFDIHQQNGPVIIRVFRMQTQDSILVMPHVNTGWWISQTQMESRREVCVGNTTTDPVFVWVMGSPEQHLERTFGSRWRERNSNSWSSTQKIRNSQYFPVTLILFLLSSVASISISLCT